MTRRADAAAEVLAGRPAAGRQQFPHAVEATVDRVDGDGRLLVVVDGQPDLAYAVAWPGHGTGPPPPAGTRCLVEFVGAGADRGWAVAFDGWHPT